jgi:hypothetical protein
MAANPSGPRGRAARVFAGVAIGGPLGAGTGALVLKIFPWEPAAFGGEYHGMFTIILFCVPVVAAYTVAGVILGVMAAFCRRGRSLLGLALGAATGLAGAVGMILVSPFFFAGGNPSDGVEVFGHGIMIVAMALVTVVSGAVLGRMVGSTISPDPGASGDRGR